MFYSECRCAESHYAECRYVECRYVSVLLFVTPFLGSYGVSRINHKFSPKVAQSSQGTLQGYCSRILIA